MQVHVTIAKTQQSRLITKNTEVSSLVNHHYNDCTVSLNKTKWLY